MGADHRSTKVPQCHAAQSVPTMLQLYDNE